MRRTSIRRAMSATRPTLLLWVIAACALLQTASATYFVHDFETPNVSTRVAANLAAGRGYVVWTPDEPEVIAAHGPLRAYQLPGEPLYLAAGFRLLPRSWHPYLHVPIAVLLVAATTGVACMAGGRALGLLAAALMALDPFVLAHGAVWDDTFMAAALEWLVIALLARRLETARAAEDTAAPRPHAASRGWILFAIATASAAAAATRLQSQIILAGLAMVIVVTPAFRFIRREGWVIASAVAAVVGAWAARNFLVLGVLLFGSTHDGLALLHANHPQARASLVRTGVTQTDADLQAPRGLDEVTVNRFFRAQAIRYIAANPGDAFQTAVMKTAVSLTGLNLSVPLASRRNVVALTSTLLMMALALAGMRRFAGLCRGAESGRLILVAAVIVAGATALMLAIGPAGLRYRISLLPVLCLAAAAALVPRRETPRSQSSPT
jgi:hypothetical protein